MSGRDGKGPNENRWPEQVRIDTASGGMRTEEEYARLRLEAKFFGKDNDGSGEGAEVSPAGGMEFSQQTGCDFRLAAGIVWTWLLRRLRM
jgi:hypothetical protein